MAQAKSHLRVIAPMGDHLTVCGRTITETTRIAFTVRESTCRMCNGQGRR